MSERFDYHRHLGYQKLRTMSFSEFVQQCEAHPENVLRTSSALISDAIRYFGYEIVVRGGEPTVSYNIFKDPFTRGVKAVYGQEVCIKRLVDVIEQVGQEAGADRGIVLVGPPASGKTNIVDLISLALEEYTKQEDVRIYSFFFRLRNEHGAALDIRSPFLRNPLLLFPAILQKQGEVGRPREEFFAHLRRQHGPQLHIPSYYHDASLDRRSMELLQALLDNPRNEGKTLSDIIDEYVCVEEVVFSNAQARGICNIDDLRELRVRLQPVNLGDPWLELLSEHLPGLQLYTYDGAIVSANRGLLHIHDAFAAGTDEGPTQELYKPLLMLLGSGKASIEGTQVTIDATVVITTNVEELATLERRLTSQKLLDRIEKIPTNYLLDCTSEMDILRRDLTALDDRYEVDPNLLRIASYYAVLTRLLPPLGRKLPPNWNVERIELYRAITPEQKLFIYAAQPEDAVKTIRELPFWHPFRNIAAQLGLDIHDPEDFRARIASRADRLSLEACGLFTSEQLALIDDEFMRELAREHYPEEGRSGISVRQLQNIMRNTVANSDGRKVHVGTFLSQLRRLLAEGPAVHHWLAERNEHIERDTPLQPRTIGKSAFAQGYGDYGDYEGLMEVARALYFRAVAEEITAATVDRDPGEIEADLRRYLQHALLYRAVRNRAFAHVMVPRFSFVDERTGQKVDQPNAVFLDSLESALVGDGDREGLRDELAERFLHLQASGQFVLEPGKSLVSSRNDGLIEHFHREYQHLLSHRRSVEGLDPRALELAFVYQRDDPARYATTQPEVRELCEKVLRNLTVRYGYAPSMALDTVVFAIRKRVVDFSSILC